MFRNIPFLVLLFSIVAIIVGIYVLPGKEQRPVNLPWQIVITEDGASHVFGLTLGKTTLDEAEKAMAEPAEVSLFVPAEGKKVIEAYFDSVDISGLRARIVIVMQVSAEEIEAMFNRGARVANMGGGRRKVTLSDGDMELLRHMPIGSLTYIPRTNLDAELVKARFGEPAERIAEKGGKVVHWLYPDKGLDVALDAEGKEVLQYVRPADFALISEPLRKAQKVDQ